MNAWSGTGILTPSDKSDKFHKHLGICLFAPTKREYCIDQSSLEGYQAMAKKEAKICGEGQARVAGPRRTFHSFHILHGSSLFAFSS
jgi:hypothetical protein